MKKLLSILLLTFIFAGFASAQKNGVGNENALLWEISGNGLKGPSYLFGTYHLAGKSFIDSLGYVEPKLKDCKTVVGESIFDSTAYGKMAPMLLLANTTLDKLFTPAEYQSISDTLKVLHTDLDQYKMLKPAAIGIVIVGLIAPQTTTDTDPELDVFFQTEGKRLNDEVIGLETVEFQANLLLNGDMEIQKRHLLYIVRHISKERADAQKLYNSYTRQDLKSLYELENTDDGYSQEENDAMLKNRNLNWMQKLPAIMAANSTFIAVGSGHLVGEYGLINQLRLKGYMVTPVTH